MGVVPMTDEIKWSLVLDDKSTMRIICAVRVETGDFMFGHEDGSTSIAHTLYLNIVSIGGDDYDASIAEMTRESPPTRLLADPRITIERFALTVDNVPSFANAMSRAILRGAQTGWADDPNLPHPDTHGQAG